ncbi:hypothetical protein SAMN06295912_102266 [Sphingomonas laterariae]|uniref:Phage protein U n=1 Tax=Edaphosphingomonas laterariae TaxID=861865 RepID=A0A239CL96_9SPHN|nr:phage tail protein [Sphingomonas laterariae]SNS20719.1 hypothetical protein SAMN06295912_102266 [Sphingomonas laterariae]
MSNAIMGFGMFVFSIPTLLHDQLQRKMDYVFARSPRVGARDATQFVGIGDETISLAGITSVELGDGVASIDTLRGMAEDGEAQPLVDGAGRVYGTFVITSIDERYRTFFPDGTPRTIDFAIDLLRVDDAADQAGERR